MRKSNLFLLIMIFGLVNSSFASSFDKTSLRIEGRDILKGIQLRSIRIKDTLKIRKEFIWFYSQIDQQTKIELTQKTVFLKYLHAILNSSTAYAAAEYGNQCLFGGWPSTMERGICRYPKHNPKHNRRISCSDGSFLCNPILFGQNKCITIKKSNFKNLTGQCDKTLDPANKLEDLKEMDEILGNLKKENGKLLKKMAKDINNFCNYIELIPTENRIKRESDHRSTCEALRSRMKKIAVNQKNQVRKLQAIDSGVVRGLQENIAMTILSKCKDKYEKGFNLFKSDRGIFKHILDVGVNCQMDKATGLENELDGLDNNFSEFARKIVGREQKMKMLDELTKDALIDNLFASLKHQATFVDDRFLNSDESFDNALRKYQKKNGIILPFKKKVLQKLKDKLSIIKSRRTYPPVKARKRFVKLAGILNNACVETRKDALKSMQVQSKGKKDRQYKRSARYKNMMKQKKRNLIRNYQKNINKFIGDEPALSSLLITGNMKDVFSGLDSKAADCVFGNGTWGKTKPENLRAIEFEDISVDDISEDIASLKTTLTDDLKLVKKQMVVKKSGSSSNIQNEIDDVLKKKPYLMANFLNSLDNTKEKINYAKYVCSRTFDIYSSDAWKEGALTVISLLIPPLMGAGLAIRAAQIAATKLLFVNTSARAARAIVGGVIVADIAGFSGMNLSIANDIRHGAKLEYLSDQENSVDSKEKFNKRDALADSKVSDAYLEVITPLAAGTVMRGGARLISNGKKVEDRVPAVDVMRVKISTKGKEYLSARKDFKGARDSDGHLTEHVIRISKLKKRARKKQLKAEYPELSPAQIKSVMKAHKDIPCTIGQCSNKQLGLKIKMLQNSGIDKKTSYELIKRGFAGNAPRVRLLTELKKDRTRTRRLLKEIDKDIYRLRKKTSRDARIEKKELLQDRARINNDLKGLDKDILSRRRGPNKKRSPAEKVKKSWWKW